MFFGFAKQTEKQPKKIEFRFVLVGTEKKFDRFEDTLRLTFGFAMSAKQKSRTSKVSSYGNPNLCPDL